MANRVSNFFRSDLGLLLVLAALRLVFHLATNGQYGFHRDELQTLDDARHLDWGFVVYPPITPLLARFELILFGTSLIGFRVFSAMAVSIVMVLAGLIAKELGGNRSTQLLAAVAAGIAPISLVQGAVFQYVSFDYLWGVSLTYFLVRLLKTDDPRWWLPIGATIGLGMETRYTMGVLALSVAIAVLLTPARRFLRSGWLWAGVALSILILLPNLIWQIQHDFISLKFLSYLHERDLRQGRYNGFLTGQPWISVNLVTVPLTLLGLWFYLARREGRRYRLLGWTVLITITMYGITGARSYYTAPLYPVLLASGSVLLAHLLYGLPAVWPRLAYGIQWMAILAGGIAFVLLIAPVAPIDSRIWKITSRLHDQFREEIGWPELAHSVAAVYHSLPVQDQQRAGILTGNYGEAGALNLYGPALGLPRAMSLTNSFWYRGYDSRQPEVVILTGFGLNEARRLFENCTVAAINGNPFNVENEESRDHPDILLCRNLRESWPAYWARSRRFG
ncbi:MAG: hypothetical protein DMG65_11895 [Candidatus Angelobacter sp. Gp1-AA117]|nr:MAG: hypothetical protein DMG65_11895 [Candidatus Angelobacter sp. Gp1-AA117]